ncbi:tumor necrosis factor receptor superfamily member 5-like isoform X1 [Scleropages formosus]|uniref:tumor necrosis factor receptor superfamily member 5-like isoform X1 n=1 Tax=Scleropages formosus TaxID=113540 RepID=UPI000878D05B|nr:tumor necrosis factor receptor superfamily member 5-like isoform X1 [Scleropages formosus]XP_018587963.1 tumor necrosis factor receptor superfamily member 5-like isoform X1 [Scleropages formosus]
MMFYQTICAVFLLLLKSDLCPPCDRAEYEKNGECCPMCPPGTRVHRHCTAYTSTTCVPCIGDTFTDKPNGLISCFPCTVCQKGLGVKTVKECTASSDTVCGVLEGNYCIDPYGGGCRAAQKHTTCKPGHFIKHPGTDSTDTVCEICPENSFSDGSSTSCTSHTDCQSKGLPTVKPGDSVSDSQCGEKNWAPLIVGIVLGIILVLLLVGGVKLYKSRVCPKKNNSSKPGPLQQDQVCFNMFLPIYCAIFHMFYHLYTTLDSFFLKFGTINNN